MDDDFEKDELLPEEPKQAQHMTSESKTERASVLHSVSLICEQEGPSCGVQITKESTAILADFTFQVIELLGQEMECFAKHAGRKTIQPDDVKLCARKNDSMLASITEYSDRVVAATNEQRAAKKRKKTVQEEPAQSKETAEKEKGKSPTID